MQWLSLEIVTIQIHMHLFRIFTVTLPLQRLNLLKFLDLCVGNTVQWKYNVNYKDTFKFLVATLKYK